ncbi:uracil-DNA glycosylase [Trichodelitschia bisporula]|uniref:Uracil-DNA glycosylase n=1 Tax=Trichodelitschia bisporula TaxID=703511 RepID=A0A6G1HVD3_9PEZI|nr:uracil-DNA glycosylase [Trichodelitschia bisporula]
MAVKRKATDVASDAAKKTKQSGITSFFGKSASGSASTSKASGTTASPKFDKAVWAAKLTDEQRKLLQLEIDTLDETWLAHLKDEIVTPEFLNLKRFIDKEIASGKRVFPPLQDVYSWSRYTPLPTVKAVILGQDPYHNINQAHGLCFSVRPPTPAPPSLKNIYIALKKDYPTFIAPLNNGGLLTPWAERGVLMLNTCLTVRAHEANSHSNKGWERFTQKVIDTVVKNRRNGVVFLAWGSPAQKRCATVGSPHVVLKSVHPSPLSASRGWYDCGHFKKANAWLAERYGPEGQIDWNLNSTPGAPPAKDLPKLEDKEAESTKPEVEESMAPEGEETESTKKEKAEPKTAEGKEAESAKSEAAEAS